MNNKPTPEILKYCARKISEHYQRLAKAPGLGMEPGAIYVSGIDPSDPEQVGLAKKFAQDVLDFNKRR